MTGATILLSRLPPGSWGAQPVSLAVSLAACLAILVAATLSFTPVEVKAQTTGAQPPAAAYSRGLKLIPRLPGESLPEDEAELPQIEPTNVLPPLADQEGPALSSRISVAVGEIRFEGGTVYTAGELGDLARPYEGRSVSSAELEELRLKVTALYVKDGYINSGAVIPDQSVLKGVIVIRIVEGRLTQTTVEGNGHLRSGYVLARIKDHKGGPFNINDLQRRLVLLQQNPLIERVVARLEPGGLPGEAALIVQVVEARRYGLELGFDNQRAPDIGAERGEARVSFRNITGWGDSLEASFGHTQGLDEYHVRYAVPLTRHDTTAYVQYSRSDSDVVTNPFRQIGIKSASKGWEAGISHPLIRTPGRTLSLSAAISRRKTETFLFGQPFSFSAGVINGRSRETVIEFAQEWLEQSSSQVIAARSSFSLGVDAFDATINKGAPDSKFLTWLGQAQWVRRWSWLDGQTIVRADLRLSADSLLPMEKFAIGGAATVRGYRENQLVADNGVLASVEWRVPVTQLRVPYLSQSSDDGLVRLAAFVDYGHGWNKKKPNPGTQTLISAGFGVLWDPSRFINGAIYWGGQLNKIADPADQDLQDSGIHFRVNFRY